ncbi:MAG TPA: hypothetical protein VF645_05375 [Allosphingosinicella sp.]|jgi:hypothetical protein
MTMLVAWSTSLKARPNSAYLASDSRITWGSDRLRWDAGRKLFACRTSPDIFGFSGDMLFGTQVLGQIVDLVEAGLLFNPQARVDRRHSAALAAIQASHGRRHNAPEQDFEIVHIGRQGSRSATEFHGWTTRYHAATGQWHDEVITIEVGRPLAFGSGAKRFHERLAMRSSANEEEVASTVFSVFSDCLARGADPLSGGSPQLASLHRIGGARHIGVVRQGRKFLHGLPVDAIHSGSLDWRDESFEAINGSSLKEKKLVQRLQRARTKRTLRE